MILIISKEKFDPSTEDICDWINYMGGSFKRINGEDIYSGASSVEIVVGNTESLLFKLNKGPDEFNEFNVCFFRRWSDKDYLNLIATTIGNILAFKSAESALGLDENTIRQIFLQKYPAKYWFPKLNKTSVNKLDVLNKARSRGILIPETLVCVKKQTLITFINKYKRIITKDLSISHNYSESDYLAGTYTTEISKKHINALPDRFLPSLFQNLIEKKYEIRSFYLSGIFYSMAIFSQTDKQTEVDFRVYNHSKPNRTVAYKLPSEIELMLKLLMDDLELETGSIDLVKDTNDNYIFLEVNPVGQFGMTSTPCNYNLEKIIAKHLINKDEKQEIT